MATKTFHIGGQNRHVSFGMRALLEYERIADRSAAALFQDFGDGKARLGDSIALICAGLEDGARKAGKAEKFDVDTVVEWVEENPKILVETMLYFVECTAPTKGDGDQKKTQTPPTHKPRRNTSTSTN